MKKPSLLHINTQLKSGSATLPYRIHEGFIKQGFDSTFLTADCDDCTQYKNVIEIPNQHSSITLARIIRKLWYGKLMGNDEYYFFPQISMRTISMRKIVKLIKNPPDIIVAYWTNFYFTQKLIHFISEYFKIPVILYLMDEEPYTGGCHMTFNCDNYTSGCGNCRALKYNYKYDVSYRSVKSKIKWVQKTNVIAVAASKFSFDRMSKSPIFENKSKNLLLLPIDEEIYKPSDKGIVRKKLKIPKNKKVILFGAASFERVNKGMKYLIEALELLKISSSISDDIHILLVGDGDVKNILPFEYTHVGYLKTPQEMAEAYQACDLFVCPTIQDAGPAMINEAIMCGRPVVSFDTGVARDLIVNFQTGYIARTKDVQDLAFGIKTIIESNTEELEKMMIRCRNMGLTKCSTLLHAERLIRLVEKNYE